MQILTNKRSNTLPVIFLASLAAIGVSFISNLIVLGFLSQLNRKPVPNLVQLQDGQTIQVASMGSSERTPEVIQRFASDTMTLMFNWSGQLPAETPEQAANPKPDPGVPIVAARRGSGKVTTATWQASFALSEDFRKEFLQKVAELTPADIFSRSSQVVLIPRSISAPEQVAKGEWKLAMVANLVTLETTNGAGRAIPFNKEIFIRAVDTPPLAQEAAPLAKLVYRIRQSQLEIYAIRDLERGNL
jgi:hypothetical protein